ncbi:UDP-glucuronosyltransferase 2C1-like [Photinus pyralis]|uniref:UDP-glucuronosyltransferase 2C1-like n=1 Tax=Photinus pyralis TaxID=7054 RepID=UPI00126777ED|nr:UDP-glucuronosyltransferase 2C1-like [Photinus pyralis]
MDLVLIIFLTAITGCHSARILGFISVPSYSHQVVFQPLWRELSLRGHQVTTLTTDPINDPGLVNLTEIDLSFSYRAWKEMLGVFKHTNSDLLKLHYLIMASVEISKKQLEHPQVQDLIRNGSNGFDLFIVEYLSSPAIALSRRFDCPYIGVISMPASEPYFSLLGSPTHPVLYPSDVLGIKNCVTFFDRFKSAVFSVLHEMYYSYYIRLGENVIKGENDPSLRDVMNNASLLFINSDPIIQKVRAMGPNIIQIGGGLHRVSEEPLPKRLQELLDAASEGAIYFSLGSNLKSDDLSETTRNAILSAFAELPYTILWKFHSDHLPNKPDNVHVEKWFPQLAVLSHPNVKLFITQGGVQSREEAIHSHVPMVGMPFVGDQFYNVENMVEMGFGLSVLPSKLRTEEFKAVIVEVAENPRYREKIKEVAELSKDQPMTGLERAVWWTEYVIRHGGATHFRSPLLDIPFYQYYFLDVFAVLVILLLAPLFFAYRAIIFLWRRWHVSFGSRIKKD